MNIQLQGQVLQKSPSFHEKAFNALLQLIRDPAYADVVKHFLSAYEYRKQFRWLGESGSNPEEQSEDGLVYALSYALETYIIGDDTPISEHPEVPTTQHSQEKSSAGIDSVWVSKLNTAAKAAVDMESTLEGFAYSLSYADLDIDTVTSFTLRKHVAAALEMYSNQREIGTSRDPF